MSTQAYKGSTIDPTPTRRLNGRYAANGSLQASAGGSSLRFTAPGEFDNTGQAADAFVSEAKRRLDAGEI